VFWHALHDSTRVMRISFSQRKCRRSYDAQPARLCPIKLGRYRRHGSNSGAESFPKLRDRCGSLESFDNARDTRRAGDELGRILVAADIAVVRRQERSLRWRPIV
jgi:hypothetical protein